MKYLKTFEKFYIGLKKYLIFEAAYDTIFEVVNITPSKINDVEIKSLYYYNKYTKIKELVKTQPYNISYSHSYLSDHIIYQSANLQDCIDKLELREDIKKYNL